jgi:hypothetical protein
MTVFVEGFEGLAVTANSPTQMGALFLMVPGFAGSYTFPSGVQLFSPVPNTGGLKTYVGDFARGFFPVSLQSNGNVGSAEVPGGTAFLMANDATSLAFDTPVYSVSAVIDVATNQGLNENEPTIIAYDAAGKVISAAQIHSVIAANWEVNEIRILSKVPIARIAFTGGTQIVVDNLTFDTEKPRIVKGTNNNDVLGGSSPGDAAAPSGKGELIYGRKGDDTIKAKAGDDTIDGGRGKDKVKAGDGNDVIIAGDGKDVLKGEDGQDTFLFLQHRDVPKLKDFNPLDDTIVVMRSDFLALEPGHIRAKFLINGPAATDGDDRIIYDPATGLLTYDADGTGPVTPTTIAKLPHGLTLTSLDILAV